LSILLKSDLTSFVKKERIFKPETILKDGSKYTGEWVGNMRDGRGTMKWADGSSYCGTWEDDMANGHGKFIYSNGD